MKTNFEREQEFLRSEALSRLINGLNFQIHLWQCLTGLGVIGILGVIAKFAR